MNARPHAATRSYLTVVSWPEGWDRGQVAALLAPAIEMDVATLRVRLGQPPPMIMIVADRDAAERGAAALIEHSGDAFACTLADIEALGPTLKIKDLRLEHGALAVDLWRGPSTTIQRSQIQVLVRAHLSSASVIHQRSPLQRHALGRSATYGFMIGGLEGMALSAAGAHATAGGSEVRREQHTSDKLDIHVTDGRVFQVDGDKFGYRILGDLRGHSDKANMDRLCELLAHLAPDEVVDEYFSLWRPPSGFNRLRVPDMRVNNDDPAFAFYSRWTALTWRHAMGQSIRPSPPGRP